MAKTNTEAADELIGTAETCRLTGIKSPATLWKKYTADPPTFPAPAGFILGRRMWRRAEVMAWREAELAKTPAKPRNLRLPAGDER